MSAVEFSPQSAGVINVEQSEAARAKDTDIGAATISAKAATLHNRMLDFLVFITVITLRFSHDKQTHTVEFERLWSRSVTRLEHTEQPDSRGGSLLSVILLTRSWRR